MSISRNYLRWKIYWKLNEIPVWFFVLLIILVNFLLSYSLSLLPIEPPDQSLPEESPFFFELIIGCVFAPIVETLAFQFLPIEVSQYFFREKFKKRFMVLSVIASALVFACVHCYNWTYMLSAFLSGLTLAAAYLIKRQNGMKSAMLTIWAIHCLWNIMASMIEYFNS